MDLPGYYFDKEKRKYFKIQASGSAPANSAYSNQDVKRRKLRDEREAATAREKQRQKGRIRHPRILEEPLAGGILRRECGHGNVDYAKVFAGGLVRRGYVPQAPVNPLDQESSPMFTICHRPDLGACVVDIAGVYDDHVAMIRANLDKCNHHTYQNFRIECDGSGEAFRDSGDSTSICENEANQRLAATWLAGYGNQGIAILDSNQHARDVETRRRSRPSLLIGPGYTRGNDVSMFSSTPAPPSSGLLFVFGSSHGILTTSTETLDTTWLTPTPTEDPSVVDDLFALEFLKDNPSILLSGGRKGLLHLTDLRLPTFGAYADTITHPSTITHVKSLDAHRIIVNGLNSNLCQYDLRFRKSDTATHPPPRNKRKSRRNLRPTRPILDYPAYQNSATVQIGFDIDLESGIVAAAQEPDEFHSPVQIFSLHGGYKLDSPSVSARYEAEDQSRHAAYRRNRSEYHTRIVKCLRFARDTEGKMKSLYVGHGFTIQRYAWGENEDGQPPFELGLDSGIRLARFFEDE